MKLLKIKVAGLNLFAETFEIDFYAKQRVTSEKNEMLTNIFSNIYTNNIISLIGKNASGKTNTMKVISFVIQLLQNKPINSIEHKEILEGVQKANTATIESYFVSQNGFVHKLLTKIGSAKKNQNAEEQYIITEEKLWTKPFILGQSKDELFKFDFDNNNKKSKKYSYIERDSNESFLLEDLSIIISLNKKNDTSITMKDSIGWTDLNGIRVIGEFLPELVKFLDPSIEYLRCSIFEPENNDFEFELKFSKRDEIISAPILELNRYLSSGTIKGINIFTTAFYILKKGGYLLVDELENHFNIEIVSSLLSFFADNTINTTGATLIFSTHYPELLDKIERNDSTYVVNNNNGIFVEDLSKFLNRNDIKKSEYIKSGTIDGTMPEYDSYIKLKRKIKDVEMVQVGY